MKTLNFLSIGAFVLFTLITILLLSAFTWSVGSHINVMIFPFSVIIIGSIFYWKNKYWNFRIQDSLFCISLIGLSLLISSLINDISFDGQVYHQPAIYALSHGWNPFYESHNAVISNKWGENIWIDHYCKGMETLSASIVACTNNMESGKAINILLMFSLFCFIFDFLLKRLGSVLSCKKILFYSILLTLSPTIIGQIFTFYIDLCGYYTFLVTFIALYKLIEKSEAITWFLLGSCIILAGATKFNMFFWVGYLIFIACIYLLVKKQYRKCIQLGSFSLILAICTIVFVGFNPYVTNTLDHGNPVYPLMENINGVEDDYKQSGQPAYMSNYPQVIQVLLSFASRPQNDINMPQYIHPYQNMIKSIPISAGEGSCLGGAGYFFFEITILAFVLFFLCKKNSQWKNLFLLLCALILTPFILPLGSNIRYVPFIYILPIIMLIYTDIVEYLNRFARFLKYTLQILIVLNISITISMTWMKQGVKQLTWCYYVDAIKKQPFEDTYYTGNWSMNYKVKGANCEPPIVNKEIDYATHKFLADPFTHLNREILDKEVKKRKFLGNFISKQ